MKPISLLLLATVVSLSAMTGLAFAAEEGAATGGDSGSLKILGAGLAFGLAAFGAGIGLGYVGSAGLAVIRQAVNGAAGSSRASEAGPAMEPRCPS